MAQEASNQPPSSQESVVQVEEVVVTHVLQPADKTPPPPPPTTTTVPVERDSPPQPEPEAPEKKPVEETVTLETHLSKPSNADDSTNDDKLPEFKEESTKLSDLSENQNKALQELKNLVQEALKSHEFSSKEEKKTPPPTASAADKEEQQQPQQQEVVTEAKTDAAPEKTEEEPVETKKEDQVETKEDEVDTKKEEQVEKEEEKKEETKETKDDATVDDDGAKTVEAIEETVVAVSSSVQSQAEEKASETEAKEEASPPLPPEEVSIWGVPLLADERSDVILLKFLRAREFKVKEAFTMLKNTIRWRKEFGMEELIEEKLGDELEKVVFMHGSDKEGHPVCYNIYGEFQNKDLYRKTFSDEEKREKFLRWRIQFLEKSIRKLDFNPGGICTIVQVNDLKNSPGPAKWELRQATKNALQLLQDNYPEFVAKQVFINVPWWYLAVNRMISPFLTHRTKSKFVFAGPSKSTETLLRYIAPEQLPVKYGGLSKDGEFANTDAVTEITVRPAAKHTVEFSVTESCLLSWELRVIGWEVSYGAEFVPDSEGSYTVIVQKTRKVGSSEEPVLCNSFKVGEPGKVVLTIDNTSSKKKKLLYRLKTKPSPSD
ncbi:patellin-3 [Vigna radiata var. radiata]|uniref:Patellin-3 n=1 Tax=Vigna radiata var. radiata TaxID=3916 RepID=A0A1S3UVW2_VIGRR|nr:patellin-3 [Vigna radiata var. radiata]